MNPRIALVLLLIILPTSLFVSPMVSAVTVPSTIASIATTSAQDYTCQRKGFYGYDRYWEFYSDGALMVYKSSLDGVTWNSSINVRVSTTGSKFSVAFDGVYVYYCYAISTTNTALYYRRGLPDPTGAITWSAAEQVAVAAAVGVAYYYPSLDVDSTGHAYIIYVGAASATLVTKSSTTDGTWATDAAFPFTLSASTYYYHTLVPFMSGKMLAVYTQYAKVYARQWNGTAWLAEQSTASSTANYRFSVTAINDTAYLAFTAVTTNNIRFASFAAAGNVWSAESTIQAATAATVEPVITRGMVVNELYCLWMGNPTADHIFYKKYSGGAWDAGATDWITDATLTGNGKLMAFYRGGFSEVGVTWLQNAGSLYNLRFAKLDTTLFLGPFQGGSGTGPIYFASDLTTTNITYPGSWMQFTNMNFAGVGDFGTVGLSTDYNLTITVLEVSPDDHLLIETDTVFANQNFTVYLPNQVGWSVSYGTTTYAVDVLYDASFSWDNATKLLHVTAPLGLANVRIQFAAGAMPLYFVIPQWFVNQGATFFGVPGLWVGLMDVMASFVGWFTEAVINIVALITSIITIVFFVGGTVIYWFTSFVTFWVDMFTIIGGLFDGTTGPINIIAAFNVALWLPAVPPIATIFWYDSLIHRMRKSGTPTIDILVGDIQRIMYLVGIVWEWSWLIFSFVFNTVMTFVSLLWGLIP